MVIFWWLCHSYRWVAVVSWLNYLILAINLSGSLPNIRWNTPLTHFWIQSPWCILWFPILYACMVHIVLFSFRIYFWVTSFQDNSDYGGHIFHYCGVWSFQSEYSFIALDQSYTYPVLHFVVLDNLSFPSQKKKIYFIYFSLKIT